MRRLSKDPLELMSLQGRRYLLRRGTRGRAGQSRSVSTLRGQGEPRKSPAPLLPHAATLVAKDLLFNYLWPAFHATWLGMGNADCPCVLSS